MEQLSLLGDDTKENEEYRAAAERAAAFKYELSERELEIVKEMNKHERRSEEKGSRKIFEGNDS